MKKHLLVAATAAVLALPGLSSSVYAAPPEPAEQAGERHPQSPEDIAASTDAQIAALRAGLKLTQAQEQNWPALEATIRDLAQAQAARFAEAREKAKERHERRDAIEGLRQGAKHLAARSAELEKLADAAKPLYDSLDDAQKRRFGPLLRAAAGGRWHHGRRHGHSDKEDHGRGDQ